MGTQVLKNPLQQTSGDLPNDPEQWSADDLSKYISATDCASFADVIKQQEMDGKSFLLVTREALMDFLGIRLGPAIKLAAYAAQLRAQIRMKHAPPPPPVKKKQKRPSRAKSKPDPTALAAAGNQTGPIVPVASTSSLVIKV